MVAHNIRTMFNKRKQYFDNRINRIWFILCLIIILLMLLNIPIEIFFEANNNINLNLKKIFPN